MTQPTPTRSPQLNAYDETEKLVKLAEQLQAAVGTSDYPLACHLLNESDRLQRPLAEALLRLDDEAQA